MTAKQLEQDTGCKIMVRGMGSMRDKKKVGVMLRYHTIDCWKLTVFHPFVMSTNKTTD